MNERLDRIAFGVCAALVAATGVVGWLPMLDLWFPGTDTLTLVQTSRLDGLSDVVALFGQPMMQNTDFGGALYRPVSVSSFALDWELWGFEPFGYQLTNLSLHVATVLGVCYLLRLSFLDRSPSESDRTLATWVAVGGAGLILLFHPLTAEVVPTPARRQDMLAALFLVVAAISTHCFTKCDGVGRWGWLTTACISTAAAAMSKELAPVLAVPFLGSFLFDGYSREPASASRTWTYTVAVAGFGAVLAGYGLLYLTVIPGLGGVHVGAAGWATSLGLIPVRYTSRLLHPLPDLFIHVSNLAAVIAGMLGAVATGLAWWGHRRTSRNIPTEFLVLPGVAALGFFALPLERWMVQSAFRGDSFPQMALLMDMRGADSVVPYLETGDQFVGGATIAVFAVVLLARLFTFIRGRVRRVWWSAAAVLLVVPGLVYILTGSANQFVRKLYIPLLGLSMATGWGLEGLLKRENFRSNGAPGAATFVGISLFLVVLSPTFWGLDSWTQASRMNRTILEATGRAARNHPQSTIELHNLPSIVTRGYRRDPTASNVATTTASWTVDSYLILSGTERNESTKICGRERLKSPDVELKRVRTAVRDGSVEVRVSFENNPHGGRWQNDRCLP